MSLGLYFDNEEISLVETKKSRKGIELVNSYQALMGDATLREGIGISDLGGEVSPELRIVANLQKAIREAKVETRDVVFSLPTRELTVRSFKMPKIPRKEWDETVRFEAKKYIPFMLEDVVSAFFIKKMSFQDKEMEVLFIACPKKTIDKYLSLLKEADLNIVSLEAEVFSVLRSVEFKLKKEKADTIALMKWHGNAGFIVILEKGSPRLVRDFSIPLIRNYKDEQIPQKLINELRISFTYYQRQFGQDGVNKIFLCIDEQNNEWGETFKKNLGIDAEVVSPLSGIQNTANANKTSIVYTALGASLRGLVSSQLQINLAEEQKLFRYRYEMSLPVKIIIGCAIMFVIGFYALSYQMISEKRRKLDAVISQRATVNVSSSASVSELNELMGNKEKKLENLKNLFERRQYLTLKLGTIVKALPAGVWIDDIVFNEVVSANSSVKSNMVIKGFSFLKDKDAEINAVNKFASNLKLDINFKENFKRIDLSYIKQTDLKEYQVTSFELNCGQ